jgi:hypothetical protein
MRKSLLAVVLGAAALSLSLVAVDTSANTAAASGPQSNTAHDGYGHVTSGYWQVESDGQVFEFGDAVNYTPEPPPLLNKAIVGAARTADGSGYWLVATDGGIFAYGDAHFYGSTGNVTLNKPVVGMASTPDGGGYWLVASDGGIFSYGDARFYGSTGNIMLNKPVVGMAATSDGGGYWFVASDGGIFSYGDAQFYGSTGDIALAAPVVGMASSPSGGYYLTASDGGIFNFGGAEFDGSAAFVPPYQYPYGTVAVMTQSPSLSSIAVNTPFAGQRYHHGVSLTVGDDGRFSLSYRTGNNINYPQTHECGFVGGCDLFVNSLLIDGGHAGGQITSISGNNAATVVTYDPGGLFSEGDSTMFYDPSTDEVTFAGIAFCGTNSPTPNDCGA